MATNWIPPEEFHIIYANGLRFYVDAETRREVELAMYKNGSFIDIVTLIGEDVRLTLRAVSVIFDTSAETRERDARINSMIDKEDSLRD